MDLSKAVQLKCSTRAPGDVNHLVSASSGAHVALILGDKVIVPSSGTLGFSSRVHLNEDHQSQRAAR